MKARSLNKAFVLLCTLLLAAACKTSTKLAEGAPEPIRYKKLVEKMRAAENDFESIRITGNGHLDKGDVSQSFKMEVRILKDSILWVDIADPVLGIKVARALVYKDSVAFVNKIQKTYFTGGVDEIRQKLNLNFGFDQLQAILSANLIFDLDDQFEATSEPGVYILANFNSLGVLDPTSTQEYRQIYVLPENFKPKVQTGKVMALGSNYTVTFDKPISRAETVIYPQQLKIEYFERGEQMVLNYQVKKVDVDNPTLNYPFNIPSSYAEIR